MKIVLRIFKWILLSLLGLGYQLYDFAFFVRKAFGDSQEKIEAEEGDMYLSPKELANEMTKYDCYRDTLNHPDHYFMN
ncbi:MAG TPA: hypothetical protein PKE06_25615 [Flavilitoribacter sp.]|nr:hypothetical protein [Flavilitoribacter sp.]HMQ90876.1 hypothetical protein [Flavilitoribacter sp.]